MAFLRPKRQHPLPVWHGAPPPGSLAVAAEPVATPGPSVPGTLLALFSLVATATLLPDGKTSQMANFAAWGCSVGLAFALGADARRGVQNLLRADVLALVALYFLTLFEFLFPRPDADVLDPLSTRHAILACLCGLAGVLVGRHIKLGGQRTLRDLLSRSVPNRWLFYIFSGCLFLGHLAMLLAVDFDFFKMVDAFMLPRFAQPWTRSRLGDWKALINELSMLLFLVPPIAGIVLARRKQFAAPQVWFASAGLAFELFYGFSSGTRNLFIGFLLTFLIGYVFALPRGHRRELILVTSLCTIAALIATVLMLQFRSIGLKDWVQGKRIPHGLEDTPMHVDMNLLVIGQIVQVFPKYHPFLGLEVPYLAIIRPIPRAIWPEKPEGMSATIEDVAGADEGAWTVAASFVGEAYIAGGFPIVVLTGLIFGAFTAWWSRLASPQNSSLGILIYASGFFAAAISMRSLFVFTTALLPTLAAIFGARFLVNQMRERAALWLRRQANARQAQPVPPPRPRTQRTGRPGPKS
jgi:hypothetical protein